MMRIMQERMTEMDRKLQEKTCSKKSNGGEYPSLEQDLEILDDGDRKGNPKGRILISPINKMLNGPRLTN